METIEEKQDLNDNLSYQAIKNVIKGKLNSVAESFVSIGFRLKQVRDRELYKEDGYKDIYEFAQTEYNLGKSNVSRFMSINDKFSENGNSPFLIQEYAGYGSSKLSEMLNLDEEELKFISEKATVTEIREIKQIKNEAVQNGVVATSQQTPESLNFTQSESNFTTVKNSDITKLKKVVAKHFQDKSKRDLFQELIHLLKKNLSEDQLNKEAAVIINPSKHFLFKDGFTMAFFEESVIKYKEFGGHNIEYTYCDFMTAIEETYNLESSDPWVEYYGEPEPEIKGIGKKQEDSENDDSDDDDESEEDGDEPEKEKPEGKENNTKKPELKKQPKQQEKKPEPKTDPTHTPEEIKTEETIPGPIAINEYPEYLPENTETEKVEGEVINDAVEETNIPEQNKEDSEEENGTRIHDLKTDHIYFTDVLREIKPFELRLNDRDYQVGDILRFHECIDKNPTGRKTDREVTYMMQNYPGLEDGYCILGIKAV
jgi:hypothetical protein